MAKKPIPSKPVTQPETRANQSDKYYGHMNDLCGYLGISRPTTKLGAIAAARTLKSELTNGGERKLPALLATAGTCNNCCRLLKNSPLGPTARELVKELGRDVPVKLGSYPGYREFVTELQRAIG